MSANELRHYRDAVSLMGGLLTVLVAVLFLLVDTTDVTVDARWVGPAVLIVVGVAGLLSTARRRSTTATDEP